MADKQKMLMELLKEVGAKLIRSKKHMIYELPGDCGRVSLPHSSANPGLWTHCYLNTKKKLKPYFELQERALASAAMAKSMGGVGKFELNINRQEATIAVEVFKAPVKIEPEPIVLTPDMLPILPKPIVITQEMVSPIVISKPVAEVKPVTRVESMTAVRTPEHQTKVQRTLKAIDEQIAEQREILRQAEFAEDMIKQLENMKSWIEMAPPGADVLLEAFLNTPQAQKLLGNNGRMRRTS